MSQEDTGTDMSEMRSQVDTEHRDTAEDVSEMQDTFVGEAPYEEIEEARYRVTMKDFGCVENDTLFVEYYSSYQSALSTFYSLSDDTDFIRHHDKRTVFVDLEKSYKGISAIFWELIKRNTVYDDSE